MREHQPTPGDWQPHHIGWVAGDDDQWEVQYVDDQTAGAFYFVIKARDSADEELIEKEVRGGGFDLLTRDEVIREFESARLSEELLSGFGRVVLIAPEKHNLQFEGYTRRVLTHEDPKVRAGALPLVTYMGWPELMPLVQDLRGDPDPRVRENAQIVLDGYGELGPA